MASSCTAAFAQQMLSVPFIGETVMKKSQPEYFVPPYVKYFFILASTVLTCFVIILARPILNPAIAAGIFAFLLKPLATQLERIKIPRLLSTILSILLILLIIVALSLFFSSQVETISSDLDSLINTFSGLIDKVQQWTAVQFGIERHEQIVYLKSSLTSILKNSADFFRSTLSFTAVFFSSFLFFILALFFFLYYRTFFSSFLYQTFDKENHPQVTKILKKIEHVVIRYVFGLFIVILTMAILNTTGLLLIGIKHAVFFGCMAAMLTIIPYIGVLIGSSIPILYALATTDSLWYPFSVLMLFIIVQTLEGNFITPNIIGNQVSINPFAAIVGLLVGGMMLGLIGVIFALPILAIIKVFCDEFESLQPIGYLVGNAKISHKPTTRKKN